MKRILSILLFALAIFRIAFAYEFADESLHYKVMYKWGLINKHAGNVTISLKNNGDTYNTTLTASSASWADKFYKVRDTLRSDITKRDFRPTLYEKRSHEGGDDKLDRVVFTYNGNNVHGSCYRHAEKDGKVRRDETRELDAEGTTVDMLSAFYYMRNLPFQNWNPGHKESINIFSGKRKELLTISYHGKETVDFEGRKTECYKITFIFTSDGKKKTSDDLSAWIAIDNRVPIKLEGKLPVGSVKCYYTGKL